MTSTYPCRLGSLKTYLQVRQATLARDVAARGCFDLPSIETDEVVDIEVPAALLIYNLFVSSSVLLFQNRDCFVDYLNFDCLSIAANSFLRKSLRLRRLISALNL